MTDLTPYTHAVLDWIVAHGAPAGTFGPAGRIETERSRAALARTGIDYEASTLGDLGGRSWSEDTYDEATDHPGLWATIVPVGARDTGRGSYRGEYEWFVDGANLALSDVILGVLEAGQVGDLYWRIKVAEATDAT